jgi:hypothetical protein
MSKAIADIWIIVESELVPSVSISVIMSILNSYISPIL